MSDLQSISLIDKWRNWTESW